MNSIRSLSRGARGLQPAFRLSRTQAMRMATKVGPEKEQKPGPGVGYITHGFPAAGLRRTIRHITGHNAEGKGIFLSTDCGDHHRVMGENEAVANILYSTIESPVDMGRDVDVAKAKEAEPPLHYHNGTVVRMVDFGPGVSMQHILPIDREKTTHTELFQVESPLHRAVSLDYGVVIEGEFELTLDSGETRIMRQGDFSVNRGAMHAWRNLTGNGTLPGRMLWVLLDCKPFELNGQEAQEDLGDLAQYYQGR